MPLEEAYINIYDPALHCTPPGVVHAYVQQTITQEPTYTMWLRTFRQCLWKKLVVDANYVGTWLEWTTKDTFRC